MSLYLIVTVESRYHFLADVAALVKIHHGTGTGFQRIAQLAQFIAHGRHQIAHTPTEKILLGNHGYAVRGKCIEHAPALIAPA